MSEEKNRPAVNYIASKGNDPKAPVEFNDRGMQEGAWPAKDKNGNNYTKGKCPNCGCKIWAFPDKREGWKLVKEDVEPKEEGGW